jgi:RNA polymerase sigma factor (sigma-70 family)
MHTQTDIELVRGVLKNNPACEEALYRRYSGPMYRVCQRYAASRAEAEDMLQEGFLRVFADLRHYRGEGSLEGWIRRVVVRAALRWLKQRRRMEFVEIPADHLPAATPETAEAADDWPDDRRLAVQLMQQLPAGYRTVLNLYALEGYSHEEIAGLLGISPGTSRSQLSKARALLRSLLEPCRTPLAGAENRMMTKNTPAP